MRLLPISAIFFVVALSFGVSSNPAMAARACHCAPNGLLPSGTCRHYVCQQVLESVPGPGFRTIRSASDCRRSRVLFCDDSSCQLGCESKSAAKK